MAFGSTRPRNARATNGVRAARSTETRRWTWLPVVALIVTAVGGESALGAPLVGRIAFRGLDGGPADIYVIDGDACAPRNVTDSPTNEMDPSWSPDQERIAFSVDQSSNGTYDPQVFVVGADGGAPLQVTELSSGFARYPSWSPDGGSIAFSDIGTVYTVNVDTKSVLPLTPPANGADGLSSDPDWHPAGGVIAYTRMTPDQRSEIWKLTMGGEPGLSYDRLVPVSSPYGDVSPVWSPDGSKIAFVRGVQTTPNDEHLADMDVYVMDVATESITRVTDTPEADEGGPEWSPDGSLLLFYRDVNGSAKLFTSALDGSEESQVATGSLDAYQASWASGGTPCGGGSPGAGSSGGGAGAPAPVTPSASFSDVPADAWYADFVAVLAEAGISVGYGDGTFRPAADVSRAEIAAMIVRALDETVSASGGTFADVADGAWYAGFVNRLAELGVVSGRAAGTFDPDGKVTRAELAAMLVRALGGSPSTVLPGFSDVPDDAWYAGFVARLAELGITVGYGDGTFHPNAPITRAEVAAMLVRAFNLLPVG